MKEYESISGIKGHSTEVVGKVINSYVTGQFQNVAASNPKRIALILHYQVGVGSLGLLVYLGPTGNNIFYTIYPGDSMVIDKDFPWDGEVSCWTSDSTKMGAVEVVELQVKN